ELPGNTLYEKAQLLFKNGAHLAPKDVTGWTAGRFMTADAPDTAKGGVLIAEVVPGANGDKPLIMSLTHPTETFFDAMTPDAVTQTRGVFRSLKDVLSDPKDTVVGLEIKYRAAAGLYLY